MVSACPATEEEIRLRVSPLGIEEVSHSGAVLSLLEPECCDVEGNRVISSFCNYIHFFASRDVGEAWAASQEKSAFVLTVSEAFELGRLTNSLRYGDALGSSRM